MATETSEGAHVWSSVAWHEQAAVWLDARLADIDIERTGALAQVQLRPWATVLQAPTTAGTVWLKASGGATAFEAGLYELLQRACPRRVLTPLATDAERGWIVLPDGGVPLGGRLDGDERAEAMVEVVREYGQLQREVAPHDRSLLALGVADMRPAAMPARFEEALAAVGEWVERRGAAGDRERYGRLTGMGTRVEDWCERLASAPGPASLDHNDLHPWNVFLDADGRARFYDWGDSVVAHPFASMLVPLGMAKQPRMMERRRDAYLDVFEDLAPRAELVQTLELACRVGKIARALTWHRAVSSLPPGEVDEEWARAPFQTLASLLDDSYLGGA